MDNRSFERQPIPNLELPLDLQAAARSFAAQPVPRPSSADTAHLLQVLLTEAVFETQRAPSEGSASLRQVSVLTRWRVYLLGPWLWIASILLLLAGVLIAHAVPLADLTTLLILLLPLAAVLGMTHALRTPSAGLRAVEASCPVNFAQTSMGLGLALLAFDAVLGLVATLGFTLAHWAPFWNLLLAWLAPLLLLTAISLPIALLRNVRLAALVGGLPWLLLGMLALAEQQGPNVAQLFFSLPQDTLSLSSHLAIVALSLLLLFGLYISAPKWQRFCAL
jgi:hypothetical protein